MYKNVRVKVNILEGGGFLIIGLTTSQNFDKNVSTRELYSV